MLTRIRPLGRNFTGKIQLLCKSRFTNNLFHEALSNFSSESYGNLAHEDSGGFTTGNEQDLKNPDRDPKLDDDAIKIQAILKLKSEKSIEEIGQSVSEISVCFSEDLVLNVLKRHRSDWKASYKFFRWVCLTKFPDGYRPGTGVYNVMLDILGRMHQFDKVHHMVDEMSKRKILINERTYGIVVNRYAAAHKVEDAIQLFYKRKEFGLELDLIAFQTLLLSLCRYKHVEAAEFLFHNKNNEFQNHIKTWNIILNGWCVLGNLREAKRFWNDIVTKSKCKPDKFTYGIFINSLSKAGKISTAVKLFQAMWNKGCEPDVAICNTIIDGLCFKKRIPEAIEIIREMNERDCQPDVATYNSLIKHLCKIKRMEKVYELLDEMEKKGGEIMPNARTYGYLLNSAGNPEEVYEILDRMERKKCKLDGDGYNMLLRLFMEWGVDERVQAVWKEMEKAGVGPDKRSYTVMIHGLFDKGRLKDAMSYVQEMKSKGIFPEPRTKLLVDAMKIKLKAKDLS
ncbi:OLC1v1004297C1 [Oldenlandia corymbosa var. corymbosa]|uniref:OLC1v1004297C1 n=1 Tax=Oldenlandia corymbosa var. corymbosa TaxID=529605 RepID=A0AAV1DC06_OLDCO|nr:OLC1v1004297C1 [Oldenlandia corymbosa var. corymbosa]